MYIVSEDSIFAPIDSSDIFKYFRACTTINFNDNFDTSKVTDIAYMFYNCSSLTSLDLSSFNTSKVTDMDWMFYSCSSLTTTINIMSIGVTNYSSMFYNAATSNGAKITVNYIAEASDLVDNMIAEKSETSNVVKGSVIS